MYNIDESTEGDRKPKFLEAGFHEVTLTDINIAETSKGDKYLRFEFRNTEGIPFTHTEFAPNAFPGSKDPEEDIKKQVSKQQTRIKHILSKFIDESEIKIKAKSFEDLMDVIVDLAGNKYKGIEFRILCDYNNKGYSRFPSFVPFIELSGTEPTTLHINKYHKMEKPVADKPKTLIGLDDDEAEVMADDVDDELGF